MKKLVIFEDEAMEIVREAEQKGKEIVLANERYAKRNTDYDGIYISEWHCQSKRNAIGFSNRDMANRIYSFCNQNGIEPILK